MTYLDERWKMATWTKGKCKYIYSLHGAFGRGLLLPSCRDYNEWAIVRITSWAHQCFMNRFWRLLTCLDRSIPITLVTSLPRKHFKYWGHEGQSGTCPLPPWMDDTMILLIGFWSHYLHCLSDIPRGFFRISGTAISCITLHSKKGSSQIDFCWNS